MLRLLSDEDVPGEIVRGLRQQCPGIDVVRVQEVGLMQTPDPDILAWAAREGRAVFSRDRETMIGHAYDRVARGLAMPGLFILPQQLPSNTRSSCPRADARNRQEHHP